MEQVARARQDLVIANRVLALQQVVDAYGHVSIRNPVDPSRFFLSRSLSPELVELDDLIEFRLDGTAIADGRPPYLERFIHGAIYEARPEVNVVIHAHAESTLPFGITGAPLRPVIHSARGIGAEIPVWDIAERFGDDTNLLVTDVEQGRDLARRLAGNTVVLMRGHGFASVGQSIVQAVGTAINLPKNARVLLEAMRLGEVKALAPGEIASDRRTDFNSAPSRRGWHYWATKAGCAHLL
ncbi:MAG TPA: class II aldolase/adducin family protein [Hyphomicrobiales bacterium]|nr:class II aldolase/adducin family protein [Hyphomicrobiales bacterium]